MSTGLKTRPSTTTRQPALDHERAIALAAEEYARVVRVFESLSAEQWAMPTACPGWDVRAMAGHMLGMAQMMTSVRELVGQQSAAGKAVKKSGGLSIDALTALQVAKNSRLSTRELVEEMRKAGAAAVRGRQRVPAVIRSRRLPEQQITGGVPESWTFGYLFDVILTRDPFMHRIDIARATGQAMEVTAAHEGVLVDDVVREWADRHGRPFVLELTGPAGGSWSREDGDRVHIEIDALEFCRVLSGRSAGTGLLGQQVPF